MYYKEYGNTGIKVSAVGLGTMRYDEEDIAAGRFEKCAEIPLYAFEKGINYWDTAPFYCEDKSEIVTGIALSQVKREDVLVTSKINFNTLGKDRSRDAFFRRLDTSLTRLQTDYIDFYHMWCMRSLDSYNEHLETLYEYFQEAKELGLIKNIVFSSHMQGDEIAQALNPEQFKGMLIGYNALNYKFRQSGLEEAYAKGMGVVVMNPLGGGMIPQNPETFKYLTEGTDLTVPQGAIRFVASHKEITVALAGCTTKAHVDDAVKAVQGLEEYSAKDVIASYEGKGKSLNNLCTGCGYCVGCPVGIDIPKYMDAYNQYLFTGDKNKIKPRLEGMWGINSTKEANKCISCKKCERECTQHLKIVDRLGEIGGLS